MAMLTGYFDAAGDNSDKYAVTVGGYVAPAHSWRRFRRDWRKVLDSLNITDFHMTDFVACRGDFSEWKGREGEQMAVLVLLSKVIVRNAHYSPASTVLLEDWRTVNREYTLKECHATPYCLAAFSSIDKAVRWIGRERGNETIKEFAFEQGDTGFGDLLHFMTWMRKAVAPGTLDSIHPVPKPKSLEPLQAADFAAWEQRYVASRRLTGQLGSIRDSLRELMKVKNDWGVIDQPKLLEYCEWLGVPKRTSSTRLSQKERARWRPVPMRKSSAPGERGGEPK